MRCPETGKFIPNLIKIGDKVVNLHKSKLSGFSYMKAYTVVGTLRSKPIDKVPELWHEHHFVITDDEGVPRRCNLKGSHFEIWEKLP